MPGRKVSNGVHEVGPRLPLYPTANYLHLSQPALLSFNTAVSLSRPHEDQDGTGAMPRYRPGSNHWKPDEIGASMPSVHVVETGICFSWIFSIELIVSYVFFYLFWDKIGGWVTSR